MARGRKPQVTAPPEETLPRVLSECQRTSAVHKRSVGLLQQCRRDHPTLFCSKFFKYITPALLVYKQEPTVTRTIHFAAAFATAKDQAGAQDEADEFVEELLGFLLPNTQSRDKALRYRSTQLVARIIEFLPEDAGISDETWEEVSEHMQARLRDKQPVIRAKAVRALSRLVEPGDDGSYEDDPVTSAYQVLLANDKNTDVRKMVVASYPMEEPLLPDVIERTRDVSDAVRKLTYTALGARTHVSKLTPPQRVDLLRRGLSDRVPAVRSECIKMVCNYWFLRDCESDPLALIDLLDIDAEEEETDEKWQREDVAEKVLLELLGGGHVTVEKGPRLRDYLQTGEKRGERTPGRATPHATLTPGAVSPASKDTPAADTDNDVMPDGPVLMSSSEALYWRVICQWLHKQAETRGSDAANAGGAQAEVMAAEADESRELLDGFLPATVAEFVALTQMHLVGGEEHRFAAQQLMHLAGCLDLTDAAGRRAAATLVQALLCGPPDDNTTPDDGPRTPQKLAPISSDHSPDPLALDAGGDRKWAIAVSTLARHVHAAPGEYVTTLVAAVQKWATRAEAMEAAEDVERAHLRCLAVAGLLLEAVKGGEELREGGASAAEVLEKCVVAKVHHESPRVRQSALHCLALLCHLDAASTQRYSPLLCAAAESETHPPARILALKAVFDLALRYGPDCLRPTKATEQGPPAPKSSENSGDGSPSTRAESFQSAVSTRNTSFRSALSDAHEADLLETAQSPFPTNRPVEDTSNVTGVGADAPSIDRPLESDPLVFLARFLDPHTMALDSGEAEHGAKRPKSGRARKGAGKKAASSEASVDLGRQALEVAAEGFAKLLLFDRVASAPETLAQLLLLHFDPVTEPLLRLRQCLAVFFDYYAASAAEHKRSICDAFLGVLRLAWTGYALEGKLTSTAARKKAATLAKFMLQLLHQPSLHQPKPVTISAPPPPDLDSEAEGASTQTTQLSGPSAAPTEDEGQEQLALSLAAEILGCPDKKSAGGKAYVSMLAKTVAGLTFRRSAQEEIKSMRKLLDWLVDALQSDKSVSKELAAMAIRLADLDDTPTEPISEEALRALEAMAEAHLQHQAEDTESGPTKRGGRARRASGSQETVSLRSDSGVSAKEAGMSPEKPAPIRRPTRQSKTAALTRMGDQKKAAFGRVSESSDESEDGSSEESATQGDMSPELGAVPPRRMARESAGGGGEESGDEAEQGSGSEDGSDEEGADAGDGSQTQRLALGAKKRTARRDSEGSVAGSGEERSGRRGVEERRGTANESDEGESGEEEEGRSHPKGRVAGETVAASDDVDEERDGDSDVDESDADDDDDVSQGSPAAPRERTPARRRQIVVEDEEEIEGDSDSADEKSEGSPLIIKRRPRRNVAVMESPNMDSDGQEDSDEATPKVAQKVGSRKRRIS